MKTTLLIKKRKAINAAATEPIIPLVADGSDGQSSHVVTSKAAGRQQPPCGRKWHHVAGDNCKLLRGEKQRIGMEQLAAQEQLAVATQTPRASDKRVHRCASAPRG